MAEREFLRLVPDVLCVDGGGFDGLEDRGYGLVEVRDVLMARTTEQRLRDEVWRRVIRSARVSADWMVGAVGLGMPGLRAVARRATRGLDAEGVAEVEAAALLGFVEAVRNIDLRYARLAWYLRCRAQRAALSARRAEVQRPEPEGEAVEARIGAPVAEGHPDQVLDAAVAAGVVTRFEAELIGATRLEGRRLAEVAAELGIGYKVFRAGFLEAGNQRVDGYRSGIVLVEVGLGLRWWDQSDLAVQAAVVEPVDVLGDREFKVVDVLPRAAVADRLGLEQRVERLGQGIVVGVAGGFDRDHRASLGQALGGAHREIPHAAAGVVDQAVDAAADVLLAVARCHLRGVQGRVGAQRLRHLPAHHAAGEHVDDEGGAPHRRVPACSAVAAVCGRARGPGGVSTVATTVPVSASTRRFGPPGRSPMRACTWTTGPAAGCSGSCARWANGPWLCWLDAAPPCTALHRISLRSSAVGRIVRAALVLHRYEHSSR
nr:hypothetical protein [Thermobifida halotolerans]